MDEIVLNTQLALFFGQTLDRPDQLIGPFNEAIGRIFDQVPMVVPVPKEPQLFGIPVVQMTSTNGIFSCNIARNRSDFFVAGNGPQKFSDVKSDFISKSLNYYNFFSSTIPVIRIGFVTKLFFPNDKPEEAIARLLNKNFIRIFNDGKISDDYARYISRITINSFDVNDFVSAEKAVATINSRQLKGVLITRDFNTPPEKSYRGELSTDAVKNFIETASERFRLEEIKEILWPTE